MRHTLPLAALLLTGCATVERTPPPASAEAELPPDFALLDRERATTGAIADLLPHADPAFAALRSRAMDAGPTLAEAVARIDAARAGLRSAGTAQLPEVGGSATVSRERINRNQFGALPPGIAIDPDRTPLSTGISASWDADLFGQLRAGKRAAAARLDAAGADAAAVRLALEADIARAVIEARALDGGEAVTRSDIASAADLVAVTRARSAAGVAAGFDLVRARSLEAEAKARLEPILTARAAVIGQLVALTALPADRVAEILRESPGPALTAAPHMAVPSVLLRAEPDVAATDRRLKTADAEVAAAAADRFPRLSITGTLGLFGLGLGTLFDDEALTGSIGAGLAGPLLDFGRVAARIDAREAEARGAFAAYRRALFNALGETEAALTALSAADRRAEALERQSALDLDATKLARERYRRGLDTFLVVIDAERTANGSRSAAITARAEASQARVALYRAVGGWQP